MRTAELDRARAEATAIEERKRRRVQVGLAASLLALTVVGGLGIAYEWSRSQARAARADRLLAEATLLRDQARAQPEDVAGWEKAREVLERIADDAGPLPALTALRSEVDDGLKAAEADRELLAQLVDIRSAQADDLDGSATDAAYADAFAAAGMDPIKGDPAEAGARVAARPAPVAAALVAALDHWTAVRRARDPKELGWLRLLAAARAADPDPDRDNLRAALLIEDQAGRLERLRKLTDRADAETWAPATLVLLGSALAGAGDLEAGVGVLRRASWAHPGDAPVHHALALSLGELRPPQPEEAIRASSVAWARQPELAGHDLAHALEERGRGAEAEAVWRDLIARRPDNGRHLGCYGQYLRTQGRSAEAEPVVARAIAAWREEIRLRPDSPNARLNFGLALSTSGDVPGAIAAYRESLRLRPDQAVAHFNLGTNLAQSGDLPGGIASLREAIRLKPDLAAAHENLGIALSASGDLPGAIAAHREAIRLKPDLARAHSMLGFALSESGDLPGAIAAYREAIRLKPDDVRAHNNLAWTLLETGDPAGALATIRGALQIAPEHPDASGTLAEILITRAGFAEAVPALEQAAGRLEKSDPRTNAEYVADLRGLVPKVRLLAEADATLNALADDAGRDRDDLEAVDLAALATDAGRPEVAARLYETAFAVLPSRANGRRVDAARTAVRAASEATTPDAEERGELRRLALGWLQEELAAAKQTTRKSGDPAARAAVVQSLQQWQTDPDLAGVRDEAALAALPADERRQWQALWTDHAALLERAKQPPPAR
jgi:Flp pilus assembly protein TadD